MLMDTAALRIERYNRSCLHYNLIAQGVYAARAVHGPFAPEFEAYLIAALLGFDMGRMMGPRDAECYDPTAGGFSDIALGNSNDRAKDALGRVYEYFLARFASAQGKSGGQFYTSSRVVRVLVEMLALDIEWTVGASICQLDQ